MEEQRDKPAANHRKTAVQVEAVQAVVAFEASFGPSCLHLETYMKTVMKRVENGVVHLSLTAAYGEQQVHRHFHELN